MNPEVVSLIKLAVVFAFIIVLLAFKRPLNLVMAIAAVVVIVLYQMPMADALPAIQRGVLGTNTLNALLVLYCITFLQRMMEKRKNLSNCQVALNGIFNNRRINASVAPFLLGCLPAASTVLICGPIVRESVGDYLSTEEKAAVTSFFRHVSESFLPTYTGIFIAIGLTNGAVTASSFVLGMLPMVAALFLTGYLVYLRKIPKDTGMVSDQSKGYYWKLLLQSAWAIALAIFLILAFKLPVVAAVLICIGINVFVNHFTWEEIVPFFSAAFEPRLIANTFSVMIFKELLAATGVIETLPGFFTSLPIPTFLVFALIFFFGSIVAGSQAIIVLCMPMAMASLAGGPALSLFILLMSMNYVAMQISPIHICLTLCAEDYKIPLSSLVAKSVPMVVVFTVLSFIYYAGLRVVGL